MPINDLSHITANSTIAELPGYLESVEISAKAKALADRFHQQPGLPGIILTEDGEFRAAVSRRYYLDMVGRYCGADLYHPRPIRFMMTRFFEIGGSLVVPGETLIQDAVRQGLERPRALVYEPLVVRVEDPSSAAGVRLVDFEDLLAADSRLTLLRNAQMKQILSTVREGLLLIDPELRIAREYSDSVEEIFGTGDLAGRLLPAVLAEILEEERAQVAGDYLRTLFNPEVIESLVIRINPLAKVETHRDGRRKVLSFRFARAMNGNTVRHILARVEDVTREEELARELEEQKQRSEQRLELALGLAQADPEALAALLATLERECRKAGDLFGPRHAELLTRPALESLLRNLHGAKGEAGLLSLRPLQTGVHLLEEPLGELQRSARLDRRLLGRIHERLAAAAALLAAARGVLDHFSRLGRLTAARPASADGLLRRLGRLTTQLGEELGKPARFLSRAPEADLPSAYTGLLQETLVQLVRNSLAHGIELPEVRRQSSKPAVATLQLAVREHRQQGLLELVFQDDGAGLSLERIRARAEQLGLSPNGDLAQSIFRPGFSTASSTDLHAGRGAGLDLVKQRVEAAGGRITVHTQPGRFCAFQILLPARVAAAV